MDTGTTLARSGKNRIHDRSRRLGTWDGASMSSGAGQWPTFAAALEAATGLAIGYDTTGTVTVGLDASDRAGLDDLLAYQHTLGLEAYRRSASECRRLVPALSPALRGGLEVPGDHRVDNRALLGALGQACRDD